MNSVNLLVAKIDKPTFVLCANFHVHTPSSLENFEQRSVSATKNGTDKATTHNNS